MIIAGGVGQKVQALDIPKWSTGWYILAGCIGLALVIIGAIAWKGEGPLLAIREVSPFLPSAMTTVGFTLAVASCALGMEATLRISRAEARKLTEDKPEPPTPPSTIKLQNAPAIKPLQTVAFAPQKKSNQELDSQVRLAAMQSYGFEILKLINAIKASLPDDVRELASSEFHFQDCLDCKNLTDPNFIFGLFAAEKLLSKGYVHPRLACNKSQIAKHIAYYQNIALEEVCCTDFEAYLQQKQKLKTIYEGLLQFNLKPASYDQVKLPQFEDEDHYVECINGYFDDLCAELNCDPQGDSKAIASKLICSTKLLEKEYFEGLIYNRRYVPYQIIMKVGALHKIKEVFALVVNELSQKARDPQTAVTAEIFSVLTQFIEL